jgi:hypothetical protein
MANPKPPAGGTPPPTSGKQAGPPAPTPNQDVWLDFTKSVRTLLVPQEDDRPLDQYLEFRDKVVSLVQSPTFLNELGSAWPPFTDVGDALIMELKAFPLAVEVAQNTQKATPESKQWWKRWLGRASTTTASVKELIADFPYVKSGLTVFKELIDLFKGGDTGS